MIMTANYAAHITRSRGLATITIYTRGPDARVFDTVETVAKGAAELARKLLTYLEGGRQ